MPFDRPVVRHRHRHAALLRDTQVAKPCEDLHRAYLDGLALGHFHRAQGTGLESWPSTGDDP